MESLLKFADGVAANPSVTGIVTLLIVACGVLGWAYWQKSKQVDRIQEERVTEAREDTELMANALNQASHAASEVKASNDALRVAFEVFTRAH